MRSVTKASQRIFLALTLTSVLGLCGCISFDENGNMFFDPPDFSSSTALVDDLRSRILNHDGTALREFAMKEFNALHSNDPNDLERLQGCILAVKQNAPSLPGIQEYASWLDSRMAYFEAAEAAKHAAEAELKAAQYAKAHPPIIRPAPKRPEPKHSSHATTVTVIEKEHFDIKSLPVLPPTYRSISTLPTKKTVKSTEPSTPKSKVDDTRPDAMRGRAYWQKAVGKHRRPANADAMLPRIQPAFKSEGLPVALAWMAEVESSMDPAARSPVGAAGLFQLMPRTAQSLGLELSPQDQRLIPEHNAKAAAKYLKTLHKRFGSWPLALAAYNAGEGRVSGLCRKHNTKRFDDIASALPNETQMYVPRVLETIRQRTGIDPDTLPPPT